MHERPKAYTVTAITRMIKAQLEERFDGIWVEGEISGYLHHSSGHRYITLKDSSAVLKAVMWRSVGSSLKFEPENGQKVLAYGSINVYERGGQYQLQIRKLEPVGVGPLELAFRQLYDKLAAESLFDDDRKQPLPEYPLRVGIVTSPTGAAVRDIIQIARRRNDSIEIVIHAAQVQGEGAEHTIAAGINRFNERKDVDIIIAGRGGGSLEDLWAFNTEVVVRAIAASTIPVVSAVGHEIDTTLADLAADLRAPTPSAAAELVFWSKADFRDRLRSNLYSQASQLERLVSDARQRLDSMLSRPAFARPMDAINQKRQYLDNLVRLLAASGKNRFDKAGNRLSLVLARLDTLSPLKILARGYTVTRIADSGQVVKSHEIVGPGERIETLLTDGKLYSVIESKTPEGKK